MRFLLDRIRAFRLPPLGRPSQIGIALGGALIVLLAGVILFLPRTSEVMEDESGERGESTPVSFADTYEEGTHEITGSITLRNRCQRFDASGMLDESVTPALVRIDITSEDDEGICLEIPETRDFTVSVPGPEDAGVEVYVNGIPSSGNAF